MPAYSSKITVLKCANLLLARYQQQQASELLMVLSILIPTYNFSIVALVRALHEQGEQNGDDFFEIIVLDDGSTAQTKQHNRVIASLPQVEYEELPRNLGRSAIRNALAQRAKGTYLLFMDCDAAVVDKQYLARYIAILHPQQLLYGGRIYTAMPPSEAAFYFHWRYGSIREQTTATHRRQRPYHSFMTNNFLIPKAIFERLGGFDERLKKYGHEDTVFGLALQQQRIPIVHLDNPLVHIGLESTDTFLRKTRQGIENLQFLATAYPELDTRLLRIFRKVRYYRLTPLLGFLFGCTRRWLEYHFHTRQPLMWLFDIYKLGLLCSVAQDVEKE
ncbi:MAG: glycosyltransferase [Bacteroidota bacterium]